MMKLSVKEEINVKMTLDIVGFRLKVLTRELLASVLEKNNELFTFSSSFQALSFVVEVSLNFCINNIMFFSSSLLLSRRFCFRYLSRA